MSNCQPLVWTMALLLAGCAAGGDSQSTNAPNALTGTTLAVSPTTGNAKADQPATGVELSFAKINGTYVMVDELTQAQWVAAMGTSPWQEVPAGMLPNTIGDNKPAFNLSYNDAVSIVNTLRARTGLKVALPTVAQWQGLLPGAYPWGDAPYTSAQAGYVQVRESAPVESLRDANAGLRVQGCANLEGNVREWTDSQVAVGGAWLDQIAFCKRSAVQATVPAQVRHPAYGVRLVINP